MSDGRYIDVDAVYVDLSHWSSLDLMDELRWRAKRGDEDACAALGRRAPETEEPFSTALVLSRYGKDERLSFEALLAAPGVGVRAVDAVLGRKL